MGNRARFVKDSWRQLFSAGLLAAGLFPFHYLDAQNTAPVTSSEKSLTSDTDRSAAVSSANFDDLARNAAAAREQDRTEEAINLYKEALSIRPDWIEGWWYIGTLYAASDKNAEAAAAFQKVVDAQPSFGPAWASLGLTEYQASKFRESYTSLLRARELGFQAAPQLEKPANYHLGLLLNQNGRFEDAWELLSSSLDKNEDPARVKTGMALAMLRVPLLPAQISPQKDALLDIGGETALNLTANRFDRAVQLFQRMLRDYPDTPYLHYAYGSALDFHQQFEHAEKQLREQVRLTPQSTVANVRLAAVLIKLHRPGDALPIAQRAVELDANSQIAHKLLARVLSDLGRTQEAAHQAELAQRIGQETYEIDHDVAGFYRVFIPGEIETANNELMNPSRVVPSASFSELAASAEQERIGGHTAQAIRQYQDALQKNPRWVQGWTKLGVLLYASNRYADSVNAFIQSINIDRSQANAWVFLGLAEFETKDYQNSYLHLEHGRLLGFHGTDEAKAIATDRLAQLRNLNGDFEGALDLMTSALETSQLTPSMKLVMGMALLRVPNFVSQVAPSKLDVVQTVGETAALLRQQKYDEAFRSFEQLLKSNPDIPYLHYAYGSALQTFSRFEEATRQFQEEIRINPRSALPHMRLALIALTLHRPDTAESSALQAVAIDPDAAGAHELLGRANLELGKVDAAIPELELAEQLAPTYPEVHFDLARAYAKAKRTDQAERERAIFAAMSMASEHEGAQHGNNAYGSPHDSSISERQNVKLGTNPQ